MVFALQMVKYDLVSTLDITKETNDSYGNKRKPLEMRTELFVQFVTAREWAFITGLQKRLKKAGEREGFSSLKERASAMLWLEVVGMEAELG